MFCGVSIQVLMLDNARVDFTKELNESDLWPTNFSQCNYYLELVKTVKIPESWLLKSKMLHPNLIRLKTIEYGVNEIQKELDKNKYRIAVEKIKKKSTFKQITKIKSNQIVAAKLEREYQIFLVEDTRVIRFLKRYTPNSPTWSPRITSLANIDLSNMPMEEEPLVQAKEYFLLGGVK